MTVRPATGQDELAVRRLLDGALLAHEGLGDHIDAGTVAVAVADETVRGAAVWEPVGDDTRRVLAIAVRRRHRHGGIGTALIETIAGGCRALEATFDPSVAPFYEHLGFAVESGGAGRARGRLVRTGPG